MKNDVLGDVHNPDGYSHHGVQRKIRRKRPEKRGGVRPLFVGFSKRGSAEQKVGGRVQCWSLFDLAHGQRALNFLADQLAHVARDTLAQFALKLFPDHF